MDSRSEDDLSERALAPIAVPEQTAGGRTADVAPLLSCPTCGGETQRFASGWRRVRPEAGDDTITVTVVCPVCRTSAVSTGR